MNTETIFRIAFWILFGGVMLMRLVFSVLVRQSGERLLPDRQAVQQEGMVQFLTRVILFFVLIAWLVIYGINPPWLQVLTAPFPGWLRWVGFGLGLVSLGFWTWTQVMLGRLWSAQLQVREEHQLVTRGPYKRIRHPLYTGMFGYGISLALVTANWVFIGFALIVVAGGFIRAPREEQMMIAEFGEEYRAYMGRTWRFLPKI